MVDADLVDLDYAYLTTTGRNSGQPREIEIWFGLVGRTAYFLAGGGRRAHWVQNLLADPAVTLRIGAETAPGTARLVSDPDEESLARGLVAGKYRPRYSGGLDDWERTALVVAVEWGAEE